VKEAVMRVVACFELADAKGFARRNSAFITLLTKKEGVVHVGDFRPVSLIHSVTKIVAKAMALAYYCSPAAARQSQSEHFHQRVDDPG
jgi:hypothetical protein